jgi:hypothetical protein
MIRTTEVNALHWREFALIAGVLLLAGCSKSSNETSRAAAPITNQVKLVEAAQLAAITNQFGVAQQAQAEVTQKLLARIDQLEKKDAEQVASAQTIQTAYAAREKIFEEQTQKLIKQIAELETKVGSLQAGRVLPEIALTPDDAPTARFRTRMVPHRKSQRHQLVYYVSRDPSAGQRTIVQKENGFTGNPIFYNWDAATSQFVIDPTGRNSTQIRDLLNVSGPAVSYITGVDAINVNGGANILAFNGHKAFIGDYSKTANDHAPVINGQYTQWGYEHLFNRTTASANVKSFRDRLIRAIDLDLQTSAYSIPLSKVRVERTGEGGPVSPIE